MKDFSDKDFKKMKDKIEEIENRRNFLEVVEFPDGKKLASRIRPLIIVCDNQSEDSLNFAKQVIISLILDGYSVKRMVSFGATEQSTKMTVSDLDVRNKNNLKEIIGYEIYISVPDIFDESELIIEN